MNIFNIFKKLNNINSNSNFDNKLEKWIDQVIDWKINDIIEIKYNFRCDDHGIGYYKYHLLAFDQNGNISIKVYYDSDIYNINLINSGLKYYNHSLNQRLEKEKSENLINSSKEFQDRLNEYRKEFIKLTLEDKNKI